MRMKQHVPALLLAFCPHDSLPLLTPLSTSVLTLLLQSKGNMADLGAEILLPPPPHSIQKWSGGRRGGDLHFQTVQ